MEHATLYVLRSLKKLDFCYVSLRIFSFFSTHLFLCILEGVISIEWLKNEIRTDVFSRVKRNSFHILFICKWVLFLLFSIINPYRIWKHYSFHWSNNFDKFFLVLRYFILSFFAIWLRNFFLHEPFKFFLLLKQPQWTYSIWIVYIQS